MPMHKTTHNYCTTEVLHPHIVKCTCLYLQEGSAQQQNASNSKPHSMWALFRGNYTVSASSTSYACFISKMHM